MFCGGVRVKKEFCGRSEVRDWEELATGLGESHWAAQRVLPNGKQLCAA